MVRVTYTNQLSPAAIRAFVTSPSGGIYQGILARGLRVETRAKRNLAGGSSGPKRIDTGRLRSSITTIMVIRNGLPAALIGTNVKYAIFVHGGTGLYGPLHHLIRPRSRKVMRFRAKGGSRGRGRGGIVYTRYSRGMQANKFLRDALSAGRGDF